MIHFLQLLILFSGHTPLIRPLPPNITIKGIVIDSSSNKPIGLATLTLTDNLTGVIVGSSFTKSDGTFELTAPANKAYNLALTYVGYLPKTILIPLPDTPPQTLRPPKSSANRSIDLGRIPLSGGSSGQLQEVSIVAARPVMKQEIDRLTYDVQADPESKSNDALEMLRKVPMITVDGNNQIQLKGSSSFQIYFNGKPSALMANNPADVLKSMDASTIQRIEVITVPPARYEAEGLAGIINIITVQKNTDGFTGSLFARYNNVLGERGSLSIRAKKGRFGFNTFLGIGRSPLMTTAAGSQLTTFSPLTVESQQGQNVNGGYVKNGHAEITFEPDSLQVITGTVDFVDRKFTQNTFRNAEQLSKSPDSITQTYFLTNIGRSSIGALDAGVTDQISFRKDKNETLTLAYQYTSASNHQTNDVNSANGFNYTGNAYDQQNSTLATTQVVQADFAKPIGKLTMETGFKVLFGNDFSHSADQDLDPATGRYNADTALTNQFNYYQNIYSVYDSYQFKTSGWTVKAGIRAEQTDIGGHLSAANTAPGQPAGPSLSQHYLNGIPSLSIQRKVGITDLIFGFTERIARPVITQLNPFVDRSNPEFLVTGNPDLRPVVNHILEFGFSNSPAVPVSIRLNYAWSANAIQQVTSLISDSVSESTYSNVGTNRSAGINLSTNIPFAGKFHAGLNAQLSHVWITGMYNGQYYSNDGNQGNANMQLKYNAPADYIVIINVGYSSGNIFLQGKTSDYIYSTTNVTRDFLKKKVTASITLYNPFAKYNTYSSYTRTPDFDQSAANQNYYRMLRLAFNYKFGQLNGNSRLSNNPPPE
jgi:hypothetical protein